MPKVSIELTSDEALVLFEWLAATDAKAVSHAAEQNVLWRVEGQLEKQLVEVLAADYQRRLEGARRRVADESGEDDR